MVVIKNGFGIINDNDERYFSLLVASIEAVDELSVLTITRNPKEYHLRLSPSHHKYVNSLISEMNKISNFFGIRAKYSKSIKENGAISFSLTVN